MGEFVITLILLSKTGKTFRAPVTSIPVSDLPTLCSPLVGYVIVPPDVIALLSLYLPRSGGQV